MTVAFTIKIPNLVDEFGIFSFGGGSNPTVETIHVNVRSAGDANEIVYRPTLTSLPIVLSLGGTNLRQDNVIFLTHLKDSFTVRLSVNGDQLDSRTYLPPDERPFPSDVYRPDLKVGVGYNAKFLIGEMKDIYVWNSDKSAIVEGEEDSTLAAKALTKFCQPPSAPPPPRSPFPLPPPSLPPQPQPPPPPEFFETNVGNFLLPIIGAFAGVLLLCSIVFFRKRFGLSLGPLEGVIERFVGSGVFSSVLQSSVSSNFLSSSSRGTTVRA